MSLSYTLPRIRTKRRRRRPPNKWLVWLLLNVSLNAFFAVYDCIIYATTGELIQICLAAFQTALLCYFWPRFWREYKRWRDGE